PCLNSKADSHTVRRFDRLIVLSLAEAQAHVLSKIEERAVPTLASIKCREEWWRSSFLVGFSKTQPVPPLVNMVDL
ncbi:MAG: hypothetical protein OEV55_07165, partial [candidate division Zixibacteria bacterium]|nr:hypothetical protein [candidate division Zixibacteria bacterium]